MKKLALFSLLALGALAAYFFLAPKTGDYEPCQPHIARLIVGTTPDFPPFAYYQDGTMVGFDVDFINAVSRKIDTPVDIVEMPFDLLIPELQMGNIHVIAASMTETPERAQRVRFTRPYLAGDKLGIVHLANGPKIATVEDLVGKTVAVNEGYTADTFISATLGIEVLRLTSLVDAILALKNGRAAALVTALNTISQLKNGADNIIITPIENSSENTSLAVALEADKLQCQLDQAISDLEADGTIAALKAKWKIS